MHCAHSPSSQSGHQTSDGLEIWRISHIPQKDGALDMTLISMDCSDVIILENIVKNVKPSDIFNEIEQLINEMTEIIGKIRQNRETNSSAVRENSPYESPPYKCHNTDIHAACSII
jgi:phosphoketolase